MSAFRLGNYVNTGGYSRLAGHSSAPGSWKSNRYFLCWKVLYTLFLGLFLLIGMFFIFF